MKHEPPFDIPARSDFEIHCTLEAVQPGPFEGQIHVFEADEYLHEFVLKVRGEAVAAEKQ